VKLFSGIEDSTLSIHLLKISLLKATFLADSISGTATYSFIEIHLNSNLSGHEINVNKVPSSFHSNNISSPSETFTASNSILAFTVIAHSDSISAGKLI
jgi:hypothetical protein